MAYGLTDRQRSRFKIWFFEGLREPAAQDVSAAHQSVWWKVMCLTGVDYFSTLGYQPGIAFLAAGALSPLATLVLVLLHCLERCRCTGASRRSARTDRAAFPCSKSCCAWLHHPILLTLMLLAALGGVFLKGFREAVGLAVPIVVIYLVLNVIVLVEGFRHLSQNPDAFSRWSSWLFNDYGTPVHMAVVALVLFPKLALGLSGFETGVAVMPIVQGDPGDTERLPVGRILQRF